MKRRLDQFLLSSLRPPKMQEMSLLKRQARKPTTLSASYSAMRRARADEPKRGGGRLGSDIIRLYNNSFVLMHATKLDETGRSRIQLEQPENADAEVRGFGKSSGHAIASRMSVSSCRTRYSVTSNAASGVVHGTLLQMACTQAILSQIIISSGLAAPRSPILSSSDLSFFVRTLISRWLVYKDLGVI